MAYTFRQKHPFDGFGICCNPHLDLLTDFGIWIDKGLLRVHAQK